TFDGFDTRSNGFALIVVAEIIQQLVLIDRMRAKAMTLASNLLYRVWIKFDRARIRAEGRLDVEVAKSAEKAPDADLATVLAPSHAALVRDNRFHCRRL